MNSPVQSVIEEFTAKYGELAPKLIETLLGYINDGWNLTKAVNQALVDVSLNDFLTENIETAIREGAAIGAGVKTIPLLKPLESEWDGHEAVRQTPRHAKADASEYNQHSAGANRTEQARARNGNEALRRLQYVG